MDLPAQCEVEEKVLTRGLLQDILVSGVGHGGAVSFPLWSGGRRLGDHSPCHMETTSVQEEKMQEDYGIREFLSSFPAPFPALWDTGMFFL